MVFDNVLIFNPIDVKRKDGGGGRGVRKRKRKDSLAPSLAPSLILTLLRNGGYFDITIVKFNLSAPLPEKGRIRRIIERKKRVPPY